MHAMPPSQAASGTSCTLLEVGAERKWKFMLDVQVLANFTAQAIRPVHIAIKVLVHFHLIGMCTGCMACAAKFTRSCTSSIRCRLYARCKMHNASSARCRLQPAKLANADWLAIQTATIEAKLRFVGSKAWQRRTWRWDAWCSSLSRRRYSSG